MYPTTAETRIVVFGVAGLGVRGGGGRGGVGAIAVGLEALVWCWVVVRSGRTSWVWVRVR